MNDDTGSTGRITRLTTPRRQAASASSDQSATIKVVGVGGGGSNAVDRMIDVDVSGVEFITVNTDAQALMRSQASVRVHIGEKATRGLGSGGNPVLGHKAAEESAEDLRQSLEGADMIFIAAGMGGGTGTGGAPVVADIAQESDALTVGVVTRPFAFEGTARARVADDGIQDLGERVDTLVVIPNDRLLNVADAKSTISEAFALADDVLRQAIQGVSDLITMPGLINLDFNDVRAVMTDAGTALMAMGEGQGETRATDAITQALNSPLLDTSMDGARGVLLNFTGGSDMTLYEVNEAAEIVAKTADPNANIIFGTVVDESLEGRIHVTVIATGFQHERKEVRPAARTRARTPASPRVRELDFSPGPEALPEIEIPAFLRRKSAG
ncbi:MAG: cell division protein FtsZ [Chloroflexota bacterium]|nr:cell division protein FtsZ [Chloroflexota bacterium]